MFQPHKFGLMNKYGGLVNEQIWSLNNVMNILNIVMFSYSMMWSSSILSECQIDTKREKNLNLEVYFSRNSNSKFEFNTFGNSLQSHMGLDLQVVCAIRFIGKAICVGRFS
jgi:hypothetical protein